MLYDLILDNIYLPPEILIGFHKDKVQAAVLATNCTSTLLNTN